MPSPKTGTMEMTTVDRESWTPVTVMGAAAVSAAGVVLPVVSAVPTLMWSFGPVGAYRVVSRTLPIVGAAVSWYFLGPTTTLFAACLLMTT